MHCESKHCVSAFVRFVIQSNSAHTTAIKSKGKRCTKESNSYFNDNCLISGVLNQLFNKAIAG